MRERWRAVNPSKALEKLVNATIPVSFTPESLDAFRRAIREGQQIPITRPVPIRTPATEQRPVQAFDIDRYKLGGIASTDPDFASPIDVSVANETVQSLLAQSGAWIIVKGLGVELVKSASQSWPDDPYSVLTLTYLVGSQSVPPYINLRYPFSNNALVDLANVTIPIPPGSTFGVKITVTNPTGNSGDRLRQSHRVKGWTYSPLVDQERAGAGFGY